MGECIGLDFGTTYSVVARVNENGVPEAIKFGGGSKLKETIESIVVIDNATQQEFIGSQATGKLGVKGKTAYRGFKMMLNSSCDEQEKAGYSTDKSAEAVTEIYLKHLFAEMGKRNPSYWQIDKIVVGEPHVWTEKMEDQKQQTVAKCIQNAYSKAYQDQYGQNANVPAIDVEFRTEPELACGYIAHELKIRNGVTYRGYVLVIDYGGGTLDVTLCKLDEDANGKPSIEVLGSGWGNGENHDGMIGSAGLRYMESVASRVLDRNQIEYNTSDTGFLKFVKDIEDTIITQGDDIALHARAFESYFEPGDECYNDNIEGVYGIFNRSQYDVTHGDLAEAYNACIKDTLAKVLRDTKAGIDVDIKGKYPAYNINYGDQQNKSFLVATIGGFSKFPLTNLQIREDTDWLRSASRNLDTRYKAIDEIIGYEHRDLAIAYGAALLSADLVTAVDQYTSTLFVVGATEIEGRKPTMYFFYENERRNPGELKFLRRVENPDVPFKVGGDKIPLLKRAKGNYASDEIPPKQKMGLPDKGGMYIALELVKHDELMLYVYDAEIFDALSEEEKAEAHNKALFPGYPVHHANINELLGGIYEVHDLTKEEKKCLKLIGAI